MTRPELTDALAMEVLQDAGLARGGQNGVDLQPLGGGVSSIVMLAETPGHARYVLKQPRPRFTTKAEWIVPTQRIHVEAAVNHWLEAGLGPGNARVPAVHHFDQANEVLVTEAAPADWMQWKARLLDGVVEPKRAEAAGYLLRRIHALGDRLTDPRMFRNDELFDAQRIDPYWRTAAANEPKGAKALAELTKLFHERSDFVHGDFSPKNLLAGPRAEQLMLVDHEVATRGDAAFDLGFFLTHFLAKTIHLPRERDVLIDAMAAFWSGYGRERLEATDPEREARTIRYLGAIALARARGKSPLEYLSAASRDRLAEIALQLLRKKSGEWAEVVELARET